MPNRFVILHHSVGGSEHWDLMLEHDGILLTWQIFSELVDNCSFPIHTRRINDHRIAYLDYEGPISGHRGHVRRVASGSVTFEKFTPCEMMVKLDGQQFAGKYKLTHVDEQQWVLNQQ